MCFTYRRAEKYHKKEPVDIICYVSNDGLVPVFVQRTDRLVLLVFSTGSRLKLEPNYIVYCRKPQCLKYWQ